MVDPHLSREQRRKVDYEKIRRFIRNRRADVEREISGDDMPLWSAAPEPPPVIGGEWGRDRRKDDDKDMEENEDAKSTAKTTSLWDAARTGNISMLKEHLAKGMDVNAKDEGGGTALSLATLAGHTKAVEFLIEKDADVNLSGNDGSAPLHGAAFLGQEGAAKLLVEAGAKVNARNNKGETPIDSGAAEWSEEMQGIVEFISAIVQVKTDVNKVRDGRPKVVALLKENGGKAGSELAGGLGGLWDAAKNGDLAKLQEALAKDADVNGHDDKGITPLAWAAMAGQTEAAQLLIKKGAKINGKNRDGATPLQAAAFFGQTEIVELLIKNKANLNLTNGEGETPLDSASHGWDEIQGLMQIVGGMLQMEVDLDRAKAGRPKIVDLLKENGGRSGEDFR